MAEVPLLQLTGIRLTFGGPALLERADLSVSAGQTIALVGRNGSGKSTLLKIAAGLVDADGGTRFVQPGATLRYLPQEPDFAGFDSVLAYVEAGLGPGDDPYRARYLLEQLDLDPQADPAQLSGGEARRAALARTLAPEPDILLLDEPTNHLDLPTIEWLEATLKASRSAIVLISHDRRFLSNLTRSTVWLDRGRTRQADVGFSGFEAWRDRILEQEETDRHKLDRKIAAEEDWIRHGVSGRRKRNVRRLAEVHALRDRRRTERRAQGSVRLSAQEAETSSKIVIEAKDVSKAYDGRPIVDRFSIRIARGDRIGIVGPNGAGKTTLLGLLTGVLEPDSGTVRVAQNVEAVTLEQKRDSLDPEWTLAEALTGGRGDQVVVGGAARHVVSYMADFLFRPEQARTPVRVLSGGERARLMLARALARPANLVVLDEPTNDLDLETLDVLEELLGGMDGTLILISHDRDFLDRIVDAVIVPEGDGRWREYAGGYSDMLAQRGGDLPHPKGRRPDTAPARTDDGPAPAASQNASRRKLSFKDKHALETLPATIAALEARIAAIQAALADPDLYARDRARFDRLGAEAAKAQGDLAAAEEQWLALEMLREEIEG